jgi:hypothetical protein
MASCGEELMKSFANSLAAGIGKAFCGRAESDFGGLCSHDG